MAEVVIPRIEQGAAFLAALEPHVNRTLNAYRFGTLEAMWSGQSAGEFADLLEAMCDWIEGPAHSELAGLLREIEEATGLLAAGDREALRVRCNASYNGLLQQMIDNLRLGALPGHTVSFQGRDLNVLKNITDDLVRQTFVNLPEVARSLRGLQGDILH